MVLGTESILIANRKQENTRKTRGNYETAVKYNANISSASGNLALELDTEKVAEFKKERTFKLQLILSDVPLCCHML